MNMRRVLLALAIAIHGADRAGTVFAQGPAPQPAAGFVVEPVATDPDVVFPMFACFDDRGRLFVAESSGLDLYAELQAQTRKCRIRLLEDPDPRTGRYRRSRVWADKLVFPMGLAWRNGKLYVADPPDLVTLEDTDGDGVADRRRVVLTGFGHKDNGSLHGLVFGPDGRLYMTMGAPDGYRLERAGLPPLTGKSGALIRCRPDGAEPEVLSRGFVNLVEIVFTARGDILGTDNWFQKPSGGVRDALVHCLDGGLYPYEPDVGTSYPTTGAPLPAAALFPAVALSGITRSESIAFPAAMRGNLFAAQHNARKVSRHELAAQGATFRTVDHDFVTSADPDFHPADVLEAGDGSLLVVDTGSWYVHHCPTGQIRKTMAKGGIYRVRPQTWAPPDDPWGLKVDWEGPPSSVAALLADERPAVRDKAVATLARRGRRAIGAVETVLRTAPQGTGATAVKQLAIWVLAQIDDEEALPPLRQALSDKKDDVVIVAAQALGLRRDQHAAATLTRLLRRAPAVRLAAAQALARCGNAESVPALWQALKTAEDRFVEHALVHALHHLADAATLQRALDDPHPGAQKAALVLLDQPPRSRELLEAAAVLQRVAAADAELRHTALRIVQGRPEWAAHAVKLFQSWMHQPSLTSDQQRGLRDMVRAFERDPSMQRLVAEAIADKRGSTPPERQVLLLEAMAEFELSKPPPAIVDALLAALARPRPEVRKQAVRTAAILQLPQLDDALGRLADDAQEPAELRLEALRGVVLRRPKLSSAAFDLLHEELGPQADPLARLAAAEVVGRCRLDEKQLRRVLEAVRGEALISPGVLAPILGRSVTQAAAPAVLDYLAQSLRAGWRPSDAELNGLLAHLPAAAGAEADSVRDLWRHSHKRQQAFVAEYDALLDGGDRQRGHQVFQSKKAACSTCHRVGNQGGNVGPDLTKVGTVRAGRDILESILLPSSTIAQGYESYAVETAQGRLLSGVIVRQSADTVVLRDSAGADLRLRRDQISAMRRQPASLMPERLEQVLTREEFRDLLAYLRGLK